MQYRPEIDGLRAIAVGAVIVHHAGLPGLPGGHLGVDVFFVISGYLITTILMREVEQQRFSLIDFYERRARRIMPAFFLVVFACAPVAAALMNPEQLKNFAQSVVASTLFASNMLFWSEAGYFSAAAEMKPLLHTWSLAVEEQFYLIAPLLALIVARWGRRAFVATLATLFVVSLALMAGLGTIDPDAAFYLAPARAWEILAGCLLAATAPAAGAGARASAALVGLAGLAAMVVALATLDHHATHPMIGPLVAVIATTAVIWGARDGNMPARLLSAGPLVGLGLISYSAYLWHQPLLAFARIDSIDGLSMNERFAIVAATIVLAYLTWRFVETPFRARTFAPRRAMFVGVTVGAAALIALGSAGHLRGGFPERFSPEARAIIASADVSAARERCHFKPNGTARGASLDAPCVLGEGAPTLAVLGDSHGVETAEALALRNMDGGVMQLTLSGGLPAFDMPEYAAHHRFYRSAVDAIVAQPSIKTVVLMHRHAHNLRGALRDEMSGIGVKPVLKGLEGDTSTRRARYLDSVVATVKALRAAGKRVAVITPTPELPLDYADLVLRADRADDGLTSIKGVSRTVQDARVADFVATASQLASDPGVLVVDPASTLCDDTTCFAVVDGKALYFDSNHLSRNGADRLVDVIFDTMRSHGVAVADRQREGDIDKTASLSPSIQRIALR